MAARRSVVVAAFALALASAAVTAAPASAATDLLADLVTRPLSSISIQTGATFKRLRFSNVIANQGAGVLELYPRRLDCNHNGDFTDDRTAFQRVFTDTNVNGVFDRGIDAVSYTVQVGCFYFHPAHNHWHFQDFARYELHRWSATGPLVASAKKVSFCVRDSFSAFPDLAGNTGVPYYGECTSSSTTGLSVGWADAYTSELQGQALNVKGLGDGTYCLISIADPRNRLAESDDTNNAVGTKVQIAGNTATDLHVSCAPSG